MRDTLLVRLDAVLCRAENDGAQARASCLPAGGGAALQLTKRPGRKPSGAASGGVCKSLTYPSGFGEQKHMSLHTWDTLFVGDACRGVMERRQAVSRATRCDMHPVSDMQSARRHGFVTLVPVLVHVPVHDVVCAAKSKPARQTSGFSWPSSILILVYVNVHRFAVNVYGYAYASEDGKAPPMRRVS